LTSDTAGTGRPLLADFASDARAWGACGSDGAFSARRAGRALGASGPDDACVLLVVGGAGIGLGNLFVGAAPDSIE